jgi:hypothetical protein
MFFTSEVHIQYKQNNWSAEQNFLSLFDEPKIDCLILLDEWSSAATRIGGGMQLQESSISQMKL